MATIEYIGRTEYTNPKAVSRVLPSIVRLTYYSGDEFGVHTRDRNGTIFSCVPDDHHAQFVSYILTTADLFIAPKISNPEYENEKRGVSPVSKVDVWLPSDELYSGEVVACDEKLNIAVIKIKSDESLPVAMLAPFSDWISMSPFGVSESHAAFCLSPLPTKLTPGDELTIVCSAFGQTSHALVFSGLYSVDRFSSRELDCWPFFRIDCGENFGEIINGAPVINCEGDVFGVAFNISKGCLAFFPVNVFFKWWKQVLTYGEICRPWIGISISNLYAAVISHLEAIVHDCGVYDGVAIEKVIYNSPAHSAGLLWNDVIYQCDGRPVRSLLEFTELLWDKSGERIKAKGVRDGCHFVWEVQIEAMKAGIVPEWLAKSFAENVVTNDEKKLKKDRESSGLKKKSKKMKRNVDSDAAEKLEENVGTEAMRTEIMQAGNAVPSEKSRKRRRKNKAKNKKRRLIIRRGREWFKVFRKRKTSTKKVKTVN